MKHKLAAADMPSTGYAEKYPDGCKLATYKRNLLMDFQILVVMQPAAITVNIGGFSVRLYRHLALATSAVAAVAFFASIVGGVSGYWHRRAHAAGADTAGRPGRTLASKGIGRAGPLRVLAV